MTLFSCKECGVLVNRSMRPLKCPACGFENGDSVDISGNQEAKKTREVPVAFEKVSL